MINGRKSVLLGYTCRETKTKEERKEKSVCLMPGGHFFKHASYSIIPECWGIMLKLTLFLFFLTLFFF